MTFPSHPSDAIIAEVFNLYTLHGDADYIGEPVSQLEHMSQAAQLAVAEGYNDEVILAAFFHDIGHICVMNNVDNSMDGYGILSHEKIGGDYLRAKGFPKRIANLVENHVQAKRYLTFKHSEYFQQLSAASKQTLTFQGGVMNADEAAAFEQDPLFQTSIRMRHWDELAKDEGVEIIDLEILKEKARQILKANL